MDIAAAFAACSRGQRDLATRAQLAKAGLGPAALHAAVATGELHRVRRRVYARSPLQPCGEHLLSGGRIDPAFLRHAQAVLLELGPTAALSGRSAAVLWCLDMLVEPDVFEVQVPRTQSHVRRADIDARRTSESVQVVEGLRVTSLLGTLRGCGQTRPLNEAVAVLDSALRRRLLRPHQLAGGGSLGRAIALADPLAGSVLESALRVLLAEAGLPPPLPPDPPTDLHTRASAVEPTRVSSVAARGQGAFLSEKPGKAERPAHETWRGVPRGLVRQTTSFTLSLTLS